MKLISYKDKKGNFGDDLNDWLWPKIFGEKFFTKNDEIAFFGIGSILISGSNYMEEAEKYTKKVIFGTGVRSIEQSFDFDESWDISFLRGPFSSYIASGNCTNYISDSAYFISLLPNYNKYINSKKKFKVSVVPYYKTLDALDWETCCENLGWNLIKPTGNNVENFIQQIAESEYVICEAMHGAIIADALRIPWKRLKFQAHILEGEVVSEFKWNDWLYSIDIKSHNPILFVPNTKKTKYKIFPFLKKKKHIRAFTNQIRNSKIEYSLSTEKTFKNIIEQLKIKKKEILKKYS
jgi:succinoglycan biosynthesis protein ExoV